MVSGVKQLPYKAFVVSILLHGVLFSIALLGLQNKPSKDLPATSVIQVAMYTSIPEKTVVKDAAATVPKESKSDLSHSVKKTKVRDLVLPKLASSVSSERFLKKASVVDSALTSSPVDLSPIATNSVASTGNQSKKNDPLYSGNEIEVKIAKRRLKRIEHSSLPAAPASDSMDWLSMLPLVVAERVRSELPPVMFNLGLRCDLDIRLTSDGTLADVSRTVGDPELCAAAKEALLEIHRFDFAGHILESESKLKNLTITIR